MTTTQLPAYADVIPAEARSQDGGVEAAMPHATETTTQAHLADLLTQIEDILDGSIYLGR